MTVAVIAAIIASTATASAPSVSSTRRSILPAVICRGGRALRRVTGLVDGYPLGADDRADRGVVRLGDPVDELGGFALRNALGDHPEVADASVLTGLGVAQRAGDPSSDRGVVRLGDPVDELGGFALRNALGDHPEVADASVLTGLGVAQRAGDP